MTRPVLAAMAAVTICVSAPVFAETKSPAFSKVKSSDVTLKKKNGYWVECSYSGTGQVCNYVYAYAKKGDAPANMYRVKASDSKLKKRGDYYIECTYSGLGQVCNYVYARVKK